MKKPRLWSRGVIALSLLGFFGSALAATAGTFQPPKGIGKAGRRQGLATRARPSAPERDRFNGEGFFNIGPLREPSDPTQSRPAPSIPAPITPAPITPDPQKCTVSPSEPPLTALVPIENNGLSATPYPSFTWYMPNHTFNQLEFRLSRVDEKQEQTQVIYATVTHNPLKHPFQSLSLPQQAGVPPLEEGQDYRWEISLVCDPQEPAENEIAQGWVRYEKPSAELSQQLQAASPLLSYSLLARQGYWYDAIAILQQQIRKNPENRNLQALWKALMTQDEVKLGELVEVARSDDSAESTP